MPGLVTYLNRRIAMHCRRPSQRWKQSGFTIVELMVALAISGVLAIYAAQKIRADSEEAIAQASGLYIKTVSDALQAHTLLHFNELANGTDVTSTVADLQPTIPELVAQGRLNPGFPSGPNMVPSRQSLVLNITPAGCPGPGCSLTISACTTTPVTLGGPITRFDLASTMVSSMGGAGGQSLIGSGNIVRGPVMNIPNPNGAVEGVVCGGSIVDTALFQSFVRIGDTRDPNLQGNLSVQLNTVLGGTTTIAGETTINNSLTVTGTLSAGTTSVGNCARILAATGRAGFGCSDPSDVPAGWTGGVRAPDVVANSRVLASDAPGGFTGANGNYAVLDVSGGTAEVRTSGRTASDRFVPQGTYIAGAACTEDGAISRRGGGPTGLVVCQAGAWRALATAAAAGDACAPAGAMATAASGVKLLCVNGQYQGMDTIIRPGLPNQACTDLGSTAIDTSNANETLVCRANLAGGGARYMRLRDITQHLSFVQAIEVTDSQVVPKPACLPAGGSTSMEIPQLILKSYASPDGGVAAYTVDNGASWTVRLRDGSNAPLAGAPSATAILQLFCYYP